MKPLYLLIDNEPVGPLTIEDIRARLRRQEINSSALWTEEGGESWYRLFELPGLARELPPPGRVASPPPKSTAWWTAGAMALLIAVTVIPSISYIRRTHELVSEEIASSEKARNEAEARRIKRELTLDAMEPAPPLVDHLKILLERRRVEAEWNEKIRAAEFELEKAKIDAAVIEGRLNSSGRNSRP